MIMASPGIGSLAQRPPKRQKSQPVPEEEAKNKNTVELPVELQEDILARFTLPQLASLIPRLSKSWATSRLFRKRLDHKLPKMIAIVGIDHHRFQLTVAAFNFDSGQWHYRVLGHLLNDTKEHRRLKSGYVKQACIAHDAGLLCVVFSGLSIASPVSPVVVCNPLTNEWKALPLQECKDAKLRDPVLVQLVVDETTCHYEVTVVYKHFWRCRTTGVGREWYVAELYNSATKLWSPKEHGVVCGQELYDHLYADKQLHAQFYNCGAGECPKQCEANFVSARDGQQRMLKVEREPGKDTYTISESVTDNSVTREVDSYKISLPGPTPSSVDFRVTDRFLLSAEHYLFIEQRRVHSRRSMRVLDRVTREWHEIPVPTKRFSPIPLTSKYFMCELRWNALP